MKTANLSGSLRKNVGKADAAELRARGYVPCVLYGNGEQVHFCSTGYELERLINTPDTLLVHLNVEGREFKCIIQEKQFNPVSDAIQHIDFLVINEDKPVKLELPVTYFGTSPGVRAGGKLVSQMRKLKVKGLIKDLPESIKVDISNLELGKVIRVKEINLEGVNILDAPNNPICSITIPRGLRGQN